MYSTPLKNAGNTPTNISIGVKKIHNDMDNANHLNNIFPSGLQDKHCAKKSIIATLITIKNSTNNVIAITTLSVKIPNENAIYNENKIIDIMDCHIVKDGERFDNCLKGFTKY